MKEVFIVSATRTPIGSFGGSLSGFSATDLGAASIREAYTKINLDPNEINEVYYGNVVQANLGQAPARQAALKAGLSKNVVTTTVNKVCASGMKSVILAAQSIMLGHNDLVVAGGMESMSNVPFYLPNMRWGSKYGSVQALDGLQKDGLLDVYNGNAMGVFADATAEKFGFSREDQDAFAIQSYKRSAEATLSGKFNAEIGAISIPQRKGDPVVFKEDEEFKNVFFDKIPSLRPAFTPNGTVTAANASTINDGASTLILASGDKVKSLGLKPLARIVSFGDAEHDPEWFTTAPVEAAPIALRRAGLTVDQIDFFEVNEAFAVVAMTFAKSFNIPYEKLNVYGGGVSLGHPLGSSGSRILVTLTSVLQQEGGKYGLAAICNGGGGASSIVIEAL
ncbi:MAG TPA: thiolase family protein [Saprospiraceae bacterium]|jgi:acetyl-CoA C-acetyltransferase|nr:thiolase family protein [Saprospiraceae bacterium]MBX7178241.1 thiolase family protein [Saprospiraceae bacterium]MCB0590379.1 thiolase family protein [Saprospiraceae bacterium]MCO5283435.1 thiolase family protein [Saprospiraceae bacterium]MCO6470011.1 thiolase family protein [Saprospiraceae bacterium]